MNGLSGLKARGKIGAHRDIQSGQIVVSYLHADDCTTGCDRPGATSGFLALP